MTLDARYRRLPFAEALSFLRSKITLDTDRWDDTRDDEADAFFTVAGAKGSLLSELRSAVEDAIERGLRPAEFRQRFSEIAEGWTGANDWRADLIYRTNLRTAYARGREEYQLDPDVLKIQPYLQFIHSDAIVPRPHHKALDGQVFEADKVPFSLPNGFSCGCRYVSLSPRDLEREGLSLSTLSRGAIVGGVPLEPEPGWDRMPGAARGERRQELIQRVIDRSPPEIAAQVKAEIERFAPKAQTPKLKFVGYSSTIFGELRDNWLFPYKKNLFSDVKAVSNQYEVTQRILSEASNEKKFRGVRDSNGILQAAGIVSDATNRIPTKNDHLHVNWLATAPWNMPGYTNENTVKGAGRRFIEGIAKEVSENPQKYPAGIQLEALEAAVPFYEKLGFVRIGGPDQVPYMQLSLEKIKEFNFD